MCVVIVATSELGTGKLYLTGEKDIKADKPKGVSWTSNLAYVTIWYEDNEEVYEIVNKYKLSSAKYSFSTERVLII